MPHEQPLLTIAIPTFNRSKFLEQLLTALAPQLSNKSQVELIISDNASSDDTPNLVEFFQNSGLKCTYIRNTSNIGPDRNYLQCFQRAKGRFFWLFGDDDILPAGSIDRILFYLQLDDFDLLYLRPVEFRDSPLAAFEFDARGRNAIEIESSSKFSKMVGNMFTMMSCNIVNKRRLELLSTPAMHEFLDTGFVHLAWTFPLLANFRRGLFVFDHLVSVRGGNRIGYSISKVFGINLKQVTERLLGSTSQLTRIIRSDVVRNCFPFLILEVRQQRFGNFEQEDFHAALSPIYGGMFQYWFYVFPITVSPLWFAELWFRAITKINTVPLALQLLGFLIGGRRRQRPSWRVE